MSPCLASGQTVFGENFSSYAQPGSTGAGLVPGSPKPSGSAFAGTALLFSSVTAPSGVAHAAAQELSGSNDNQFAQAVAGATNTTVNGTTQWVLTSANEAASAGKSVTISFDFYMAGTTGTAKTVSVITYGQILNRASFADGRGLGINISSNGTVNYYSGTGASPTGTAVGTFSPNQRQTFSVTLNYATHTFVAQVGGASLSGSFNPAVSDIRSVWLNNSTSNNADFFYDNVKILIHASPLTLASSGSSAYVIARASDATAAEVKAAEQFHSYFAQVTGVTLPIYSETSVAASAKQILIGYGPRVTALLPEQDLIDLGKDAFVVRTVGENLVLAGGRPRGTLYAVYDFLEKQLNCKWWTPAEKTIPTQASVILSHQDTLDIPYFEVREQEATGLIDDPAVSGIQNEEFATIMRANGTVQPQSLAWGGHEKMIGLVHTHFSMVPPAPVVFDEPPPYTMSGEFSSHPDWYTNPNNGNLPHTSGTGKVPDKADSQLNLTASGIDVVAGANANIHISRQNDTGMPSGFISVSQNDNDHDCACTSCVNLRAAYGGRQSAPVLTFVNKVAAIIKASHPDVLVETLAYRTSLKPPVNGPGVPLLVPDDNVLIRFAPLTSDFGHEMNSVWNSASVPNEPAYYPKQDVQNNLPAWSAISKQLFFWHYVSNFKYAMLPYPNHTNFAADLRFFFENKVLGVLAQGDKYTNGVGDFAQLRSWVMAKLLWNPYLDQSALTNEFLNGYYGAAGLYLRSYLDLVRASYVATNRKLMADESAFAYMNYATMAQGKILFDQAESAVSGHPAQLARVQRERVSFDLMWIYQHRVLQQCAAKAGLTYAGPANPATFLDTVKATAMSHGVRAFQENNLAGRGGFVGNEYPRLKRKVQASAPLPTAVQSLVTPGTENVNVIELYPDDFTDWNLDADNVVADPSAPTGYALRFSSTAMVDWKVQFDLRRYGSAFLGTGQWRMFVEMRAESSIADGDPAEAGKRACDVFVYDLPKAMAGLPGTQFGRTISLSQVSASSYTVLPVGKGDTSPWTQTSQISEDCLLYFAHPSSWQALPVTVYIHRVFFVRM